MEGGTGRAPSRGFGHLPALDGLRGLAVAAVVLFHGGHLAGGYLGVDAFFVLSGFLITSLLLHEIDRGGRVDLRAFWSRRFRRLLPACLFLVLAVAAYANFVAAPVELPQLRGDALATLTYVANWHSLAANHGYWDLFRSPSPLEHMWSLAIEEQFYLVWPLALAAVAWWSRRRSGTRAAARVVLAGSIALALVSTVRMATVFSVTDTNRAYLGTDTRAGSILVGAALAAWVMLHPLEPGTSLRRRRALEGAAMAGAVGLAVAWATVGGQSPRLYRGGFLACAIGVAVVIAAGAHPDRGPVARVLSVPPLRRLGAISYGLYLWHWPVFVAMTPARTHLDGLVLLAARIAVSVACAVVSYVVVEQPVRLRRIRIPVPWVSVPSAVLSLALVVAAATSGTVPARAGFASAAGPLATGGAASPAATRPSGRATPAPPRRGAPAASHAVVTVPAPDAAPSVPAAGGPSPVATGSPGPAASAPATTGARRVLLVGDSLATSIVGGARFVAPDLGVDVVNGAVNGCQLDADVTALEMQYDGRPGLVPLNPTCLPTWRSTRLTSDPDVVVLVYGTASAFERFQLGGHWVDSCDQAYAEWYRPLLRSALRALAARGVPVELATLPYPVGAWLPSDARARIDCMNQLNRSAASTVPGVRLLDLGGYICPRGACLQTVDGEPLRADGVHFGHSDDAAWTSFSGAGAVLAARWVLTQALAAPNAASIHSRRTA